MARHIYLNDDYQYLHYVDERDATQDGNVRVPKTGLTVSAYLSLSPTTIAAIADTTIALTEQPAASGWYAGTLDKATVATALTAQLGKRVWEVAEVSGDHIRVTPLDVRASQVMP